MTEELEPIRGDLPEIPPDKNCNGRDKTHSRYCQQPAGWGTDHPGTGRCKLHGGSSVRGVQHHNFKTGKYSKALPEYLVPEYESLISDPKWLELKEEVHLMSLMILSSLQDIKNNSHPSTEFFRRLKAGFVDMKYLLDKYSGKIPMPVSNAMKDLGKMFKEAQDAHLKRVELMGMMEQKRKLLDSERKRLMDSHSLFNAEQVMALVAGLLSIIREEVPDMDTQERIRRKVRKLMNKLGGLDLKKERDEE